MRGGVLWQELEEHTVRGCWGHAQMCLGQLATLRWLDGVKACVAGRCWFVIVCVGLACRWL